MYSKSKKSLQIGLEALAADVRLENVEKLCELEILFEHDDGALKTATETSDAQ